MYCFEINENILILYVVNVIFKCLSNEFAFLYIMFESIYFYYVSNHCFDYR